MKNRNNEAGLSRKESILIAAARVFASHGYDGTSFGTVAKEAGLSKTLVQYHFENKETLWRQAVRYVFQQRTQALPQYLDGSYANDFNREDKTELIRNLFRGIIRFTFDHPEWVNIMFKEAAAQSPRLDWMVEEFFNEDFQQGHDVMVLLQQHGLLPEVEPMHLLHIVSGALIYPVNVAPITARVLGVDPTSDAYIEQHLDTLLKLLVIRP